MIDHYTLNECKKNSQICSLKIKNLEHGIQQLEAIISEADIDQETLIFLRRKVAESIQDLETLYLIRED